MPLPNMAHSGRKRVEHIKGDQCQRLCCSGFHQVEAMHRRPKVTAEDNIWNREATDRPWWTNCRAGGSHQAVAESRPSAKERKEWIWIDAL